MAAPIAKAPKATVRRKKNSIWLRMKREKYYYLLILPGVLYFIVYRYIPMLGNIVAFQDYSPFLGFAKSPWVGFKHFMEIFGSRDIVRVLWNTVILSFLQLVFSFPAGIILSLMLNELRSGKYKRVVQSIVYLPHFISWVVVIGIVNIFMKYSGIVNRSLNFLFGMAPIYFLQSPGWFRPLIVLENIWKNSGWGTILILAAIAGINPNLYEAAIVDGANRWRQMWHITLPSIRSIVVILLILSLGSVLNSGFLQIYLTLTVYTRQIGDVLDTYVYVRGIQQGDWSFSTAVGLFKGIVGLILIVGANKMAKRYGEEGVF